MKLPTALSIAGSDSGGGAGIQADLKTFAALKVHGTCAVTAITAQNTVTVTEVLELPPSLIRAQIEAVVSDFDIRAVKTGMLSSSEIIQAVAAVIEALAIPNLVVDPVMVAKGGARLLREDAVEVLRSRLIPLAMVLTPNLPEAEVLLGRAIMTLAERRAAAVELGSMGPRIVVVKGGHAGGDAIDILWDGTNIEELAAPRQKTTNTHGSGCVFSAAITANLARGLTPPEAVRAAKEFIDGAIEFSLEVGHGHGPVNPLYRLEG